MSLMGSYNLKSALLFLLRFILAFHILPGQSAPSPPTGFPCNLVDCGHGTCNSSSFPFPPFECVCDPGWKQIELGSIKFPPCVLPNCTLDLSCGGAHPPPPLPPPPPPPASLFPPLFPPINFSDPCNYTSCGDGTCVRTEGSGYRCDCNEGCANLLNNTGLPCVPLCAIEVDCNSGLSPPSPPPHTSDTSRNGLREDRSFSATRHGLKVLLLAAILFPWI